MVRNTEKLECRVAARFAKTKDDVPPDFQGNPETHGIESPRGGGFSIMQNLQKDLVEEEDKDEEKSKKKDKKAMASRVAMYWCSPGRTYRLTRQEQGDGPVSCPKCRGPMEKEPFTRSEKMFRCPECGFKVPSGKVTTKKIEIEIEPNGEVEVEVTARTAGASYEVLKDIRTKRGVEFKKGENLRVVEYKKNYPYGILLEDSRGEQITMPASIAHKYLKRFPKPPSLRTLEKWMMDGVAKSLDGKRVEPDGWSSSGAPSWLLALGMI